MNNSEELRMTYSGILSGNGEKTVRVVFERGTGGFAEGIVPSGKIEKSSGFTEDELAQLSAYLTDHAHEILKEASKINPLKDWLHGK